MKDCISLITCAFESAIEGRHEGQRRRSFAVRGRSIGVDVAESHRGEPFVARLHRKRAEAGLGFAFASHPFAGLAGPRGAYLKVGHLLDLGVRREVEVLLRVDDTLCE